MVSFVIRCIITFALLECVQYSTDFTHVDVRDPHPCLTLVDGAQALPGDACLYHDITLHGEPLARRFWLGKPGGVQFESRDATIRYSAGNQTGWTWRTYLLLFGAFVPWIFSLIDSLIRFQTRNSPTHAERS